MNSREYWQKRYLQLKASSERTAVQYERKMLQQMDTINTQISQMVVAWYKRYARTSGIDFTTAAQELKRARGKDWGTTLDDFIRKAKLDGYEDELDLQYIQQQVARLQQLQSQIMNQVAPVVPELTDSMSEQLQQTYLDTYEHATYLNEGVTGMQGNFANYDETAVKMAVSNPWGDGQMFSKRIWNNFQSELPKMLTDAVMRGTVLGENSKKISKRIAAANNTFSEVNIHRLVQSELAHVTEEATFKSYADTGVEEYTYMATLESHTCPICGDLDLQRFKLSDKQSGVNYPTIHPYCRCTTAAWNEDMPPIGKRWSKDPETGKRNLVDGISFEEWARQHEASLHRVIAEERRESEAELKAKKTAEAKQHADSIKVENHAERMKPKIGNQYEWNEINPEQYNKHAKGAPEYDNYAKTKKRSPSQITLSPSEVDSIIAKYGRTGEQDTRNQIRFKNDQPIGYFVDIDGNRWPTYQGRISYRKGKGSHITPSRPDYLP